MAREARKASRSSARKVVRLKTSSISAPSRRIIPKPPPLAVVVYSSPRFLAAGDAALLVEFGDEFGGNHGRALQAGDVLSVGKAQGHLPSLAGRALSSENRPRYREHPIVRVVLGPQDDYFTPEAVQTFLSQEYQVSTSSDRMGIRLQGPPLIHKDAKEIVSSGIPLGAIQVPPNAQPIVLMADRPSVGGYPLIATVIQSDIPLLAQFLPGQSRVRFQAISVEQAQSIYRAEANRWRPERTEPDASLF